MVPELAIGRALEVKLGSGGDWIWVPCTIVHVRHQDPGWARVKLLDGTARVCWYEQQHV
jgi:hypothetical protein